MANLITYRCPHCRGDNVGYEATSDWCVDSQSWVLGSTYDHAWCNDCGDIKLVEHPLTRTEVAERRARRARHPLAELIAAAVEADASLTDALNRLEATNAQGRANAAVRAIRKRRTDLRKAITRARANPLKGF
jgi:hypothetical protein